MLNSWDDPFDLNDNADDNSVILIVNNERFPCKKTSLQNASAYFQAMFNSSMLESTAKEIAIRDVDSSVFKTLLDYAHTNLSPMFTANENNFSSTCELLKAACIFQFDEVSELCCQFLASSLSLSNCLKIWEIADILCLPDLHSKARNFVFWNGDILLDGDELLSTSFERFLEIISDSLLVVVSELSIFNCVMKWIQENSLEKARAIQLVSKVRVADLLHSEYEVIMKHNFMRTNFNDIPEAFKAYNLQGNYRDEKLNDQGVPVPNLNSFTHSWKTRGSQLKQLLYGYSFQGRKNKLNIHLFMQGHMNFYEIAFICVYFKTLVGFGVCIVGKDVYLFGGREKVHFGKWNQQMWKYDSLTGKWTSMRVVPFLRRHFQCLVLGKKIFVLGGFGEYRVAQTTMLSYDTETEIWKNCAPPPECNFSPAVATGHYQNAETLFHFSMGVFVYNVKEDAWKEINKSCVLKGIQHAIQYGGYIYVMVQDLYANGAQIYMYDTNTDETSLIGSSLSEDCVNFSILDGKCFVYTDNGIEMITLPTATDAEGGTQVTFRWRDKQQKPLNAPLKYVGLIPYFGQ